MDGKWQRLKTSNAFESDWLNVDDIEVKLPDKSTRQQFSVKHGTGESAGVVAYDADKGILLIWRHRIVTDTWGWELPAGMADRNELLEKAAEREMLEETGWKPNKLKKLVTVFPFPGVVENMQTSFFSEGATWVGPGRDKNEVSDVAWLPVDQVKAAIKKNEVSDSFTLTSLLYAFQFELLQTAQTVE
jgi:8-oxo-dGTP pyrophosphatase MutT (NUDIX family)